MRDIHKDDLKKKGIVGFEEWIYDEISKTFTFRNQKKDDFPSSMIISISPIIYRNVIPKEIAELLDTSYRLKISFEVFEIQNNDNLYDQQDAFFLPYARFIDVLRPGPNIYIYEKNGL